MKDKKNLLYIFFLTIILVLGGFLRLYRISDYMTFLGDEGRDVLVVHDILHGNLTLLGPTASVGGFFMGPVYYYFMAPFLWIFNYDPVGPAVMVGLFGVATILLIYILGSIFFGRTAGLFAALFYAISPLAIAYSRSSWNPNLMPFFTTLLIITLYFAVKKNNGILFLISGIIFGILLQLHYIIFFLSMVVISYVIFSRFVSSSYPTTIKKLIRIFLDGIFLFIGFLIGMSPFLAFELRHEFLNIQSIFKFIFQSGDTGAAVNIFYQWWVVLFRLFGRLITAFPPPEQVSANFVYSLDLFLVKISIPIFFLWIFTVGIMVGSIGLLLYSFIHTSKIKKEAFYQYLLIICWLFIGIFFFGFYKKNIYDYYFQFLFPIPFLLTGFLLSFLFFSKKINMFGKVVAGFIFIFIVALNLNGIPFRSIPNRQKDQVKLISDFVLKKTGGKPYNFALITLGNSDHGYRYFFKLAGQDPVVIQNEAIDPKRTSVTDQLLIVCEDPNCQPLGNSTWEVAGFGRAEIVNTWPVSVVKVVKLKHYLGEIEASSSAK